MSNNTQIKNGNNRRSSVGGAGRSSTGGAIGNKDQYGGGKAGNKDQANKAAASSIKSFLNTTTASNQQQQSKTPTPSTQQINNGKKTIHEQVISVNNKIKQLPETLTYNESNQRKKRKNLSPMSSPSTSSKLPNSSIQEEEMAEDQEDTEEVTTEEFITVQSKRAIRENKRTNNSNNENNTKERIPAIKIRVSDAVRSNFYNNPLKVFNEIQRCFPSVDLVIKFAEFAKYDNKTLVIATDDQKTYDRLKNKDNWPQDAFERGVQTKKQDPTGRSHGYQVTYSFSICNFPVQIDVGTESIISKFKELGFNKAVRTINSKNNEPTSFLRLFTESKEVYNKHMYNRAPIFFLYQRFYAIPETRPLQCRNCQGLGHIAFDCPKNEPTCLQCSGNHRVRDCDKLDKDTNKYTETHCANCGTADHNSCSRKCTKIKEHIKEKEDKKKGTSVSKPQPPTSTKDKASINRAPTQRVSSSAQPRQKQNQQQKNKPSYSSIVNGPSTEATTTKSQKNNNNIDNDRTKNLEDEIKELKSFIVTLIETLKQVIPEQLMLIIPASMKNQTTTTETIDDEQDNE